MSARVKVASPRFTAEAAEALYQQAHAAGMAALVAASPTPMVVGEADGLSERFKPGGQRWYVSEGACGFGWVVVHPGNSSFARRMKQLGHGAPEYGGGWTVKWVREGGQSVDRKHAYAQAFAAVLREAGVQAFGQSRMD